jgi:hypothetical protein
MLNTPSKADIGYKLHCLEIEMAQLQSELETLRQRVLYEKMLSLDFEEIVKKGGEPRKMFLMKTYW